MPKQVQTDVMQPMPQASDSLPPEQPQEAAPPTTEQMALSPTWGQGGRFVINTAGERVPAPAEE